MFNLLATILAIVTMIAVGVAGLSYLGPSFATAGSKAAALQVIDGGVQIAGAAALARAQSAGVSPVDGGTPGAAVAELVAEGYLQAPPALPTGVVASDATWTIATPPGGNHPILALRLDGSKAGTAALCAELAKTQGFGCTRDLANVGAAQ